MKRLEKFNNYVQKSVKLSCLVSFLAGSLLKILIVLILVVYYFIVSHMQGGSDVTIEALKSTYPSGIQTPPISKYFSALIFAPLIENLILPLTVWLFARLRAPTILAFLSLGGLSYYTHFLVGGMVGGIAAVIMFTFILAQYLLVLEIHGKRNAYWFTVITHFAFNLTTFAFIHIMNVIIL